MRRIISRKPHDGVQTDVEEGTRGLELVEMEGIYMGYILLIGLWMSVGRLLLCESNSGMWSIADGAGDISISTEVTINFKR